MSIRTVEDDEHQKFMKEFLATLATGVKMNPEDVLALWHLFELLPGMRTRRIWLETGDNVSAQPPHPHKTVTGLLHILGRHEADFAAKIIGPGDMFSRVSDVLLRDRVHDGSKRKLLFLENAESTPCLIAMEIGENRFIVASYPESLARQKLLAWQKEEAVVAGNSEALPQIRRSHRGETSTEVSSQAEISSKEEEAFALTINQCDALMYKEQGRGFLAYYSAEDLVSPDLAKLIDAYGDENFDISYPGGWSTENIMLHTAKGFDLACRVFEEYGISVYMEMSGVGWCPVCPETIALYVRESASGILEKWARDEDFRLSKRRCKPED